MRTLLTRIIKAYQLLLSPFLGRSCRFYPTCSSYALQAIEQYGALRGSWLAIKRIGRCHPWHPGGEDPLPSQSQSHDVSHPPHSSYN